MKDQDPLETERAIHALATARKNLIQVEGWPVEFVDRPAPVSIEPTDIGPGALHYPDPWPDGAARFKPTGTSLSDLAKAGALIIAEMERIYRANADARRMRPFFHDADIVYRHGGVVYSPQPGLKYRAEAFPICTMHATGISAGDMARLLNDHYALTHPALAAEDEGNS